LLTTNDGKKIYMAQDTGLFGDMKLIGEEGIDLALFPIGDNFTMGPDDALRAVKLLEPKVVIPIHYNTFDLIAQDANAWKERVEKETSTRTVLNRESYSLRSIVSGTLTPFSYLIRGYKLSKIDRKALCYDNGNKPAIALQGAYSCPRFEYYPPHYYSIEKSQDLVFYLMNFIEEIIEKERVASPISNLVLIRRAIGSFAS
jgi:hypothetical protein